MFMTNQECLDHQKARFRKLSKSRKNALRREAADYCREYPHMADSSIFWRNLSARHVLEAFYGENQGE